MEEFTFRNNLLLCDRVLGETYFENPLITLVRELVESDTFMDPSDVLRAIRSSIGFHNQSIERLLQSNNHSVVDVGKIFTALTGEQPRYQLIISEIVDIDRQALPKPECRDCVAEDIACSDGCPYGRVAPIIVASAYDVYESVEKELTRALFEELTNDAEYCGFDLATIDYYFSMMYSVKAEDSNRFLMNVIASLFGQIPHEKIRISISVIGASL